MSNNVIIKTQGPSISIFSLLTVLFVGLKLTGYITWSWWWVFFPLWGPVAIVLGIAFIWLIVVLFMLAFSAFPNSRR